MVDRTSKAPERGQRDGYTKAFEEAYARLNPAQKQAVDAIDGPVMVIAGPGTGKTQILALRIANILRMTDTAPSSILALTFTESGVSSMRARLVSLIGQEGYGVRIHTFHGFCNEVIRLYPDHFPQIIGRQPLIDIDAIRIIKMILDRDRPPLLRPQGAPDFYIRDILRVIAETKREHISPEGLSIRIKEALVKNQSAPDRVHEKGAHRGKVKGAFLKEQHALEKAAALAEVYEAYEHALAEEGHYDFEDTIVAAVEALSGDGELKLMLQEEHQYILADEHQDANGSQNELLSLLSDFHESPNLFIVGDEKQAIYRFQGASLENFFGFRRRYPTALVIPLTDNYRSTQRILDAAHTLLAPSYALAEEGIERPELRAQASHSDMPITLAVASDEDSERAHIARKISDQLADGVSASEVAILVRRNSDISPVLAALSKYGIAYTAHGDDPVLAHPAVTGFVTFLRAVADFGDDEVLYAALALPVSGVPLLDVYRLSTPPLYERAALHTRLADREALVALGVQDVDSCTTFMERVNTAARSLHAYQLSESIERMAWSSGCLADAMSREDAFSSLSALRSVLQYIRTLIDAHPDYALADIVRSLDEAKEYRIALGAPHQAVSEGVMVMTAHRAKGMEFDHVYIPFVHDARWGGARAFEKISVPLFEKDTGSREGDERRLMYVAMTRARKSLTFSYAERAPDGKTQLLSRFIDELTGHYETEHIAPEAASFFGKEPAVKTRVMVGEAEKEYLRDRFLTQGLSVSALNNFLESPWKYFFVNLLRAPAARAGHLLYGSAIDEALKWYTVARAQFETDEKEASEAAPDADALVRVFTAALARQPLTRKDFEMYRERGVGALSGYYAEYARSWYTKTESAVRIIVPFDTSIPSVPFVTLRGELDKVEFIDAHTVRVVDYKTGKPKTRGDIMGTTKSSNGNLFRQLVFYTLLIEKDDARDWEVQECILDFVEPDGKGTYHREHFSVTKDDRAALIGEINAAVEAIYSFAFLETECDPGVWSEEGCALVQALKRRLV